MYAFIAISRPLIFAFWYGPPLINRSKSAFLNYQWGTPSKTWKVEDKEAYTNGSTDDDEVNDPQTQNPKIFSIVFPISIEWE